MRSFFLHRYFDNEQPVSVLVNLETDLVQIWDRESGALLGGLTWANNSLTGDTSFLPADVIAAINTKLVLVTTRVIPVYVPPPEGEEVEQDELPSE